MQDGEDFDDLADTVDDDIVRVDHGLARAGDASGAMDEGMIGKALGHVLDRVGEAIGRRRIAIGDVGDDRDEIGARLSAPDERRHRAGPRRWRAPRP